MVFFIISFIAGILTVLAPCVLPLLPVIVGGSLAQGKTHRSYVIAISLGVSVVIFTLLLKVSTAFIHVPQSTWQFISGGILVLFGVVMVFPTLWDSLGFVNVLNRSSNRALAAGYQKNSLWGDMIMGAALGPVFASCSPTYFIILATVLPASFFIGLVDLIAYAIGLSGFLLLIALLGQRLVDRLGVTIEPRGWFRRILGILFVLVGLLVATGVMAKIEASLLERGFDATAVEQRLLGAPVSSASQSATSTTFLTPAMKSGLFPKAVELVAPDGYINTDGQPITIAQYKDDKVVLLDIWTYSCINCQRTLPYLKEWYEKYHDLGLEIIGVHTPEFGFEKVLANVERAVQKFGIRYPVILDNSYQTWNAYGNQYWPRKYLIDMDGYIIYDHIGEGKYDETEKQIQRALIERAMRLGRPISPILGSAPRDEAADLRVNSPETYFGSARNELLGNGRALTSGQQTLTIPAHTSVNTLYLGGVWKFDPEFAQTISDTANIQFSYASKDVYIVASADTAVTVRITRDGGQGLGADRGADVAADGTVRIQEDRLYKLIEGDAYGEHTIEIEILAPGVHVYTFTFG